MKYIEFKVINEASFKIDIFNFYNGDDDDIQDWLDSKPSKDKIQEVLDTGIEELEKWQLIEILKKLTTYKMI